MRAILNESQRLQRYLKLGEDTHTWEKGKEREERPKQTPGPSMSYFPEEHKLQGRFASRAASERTIEYGQQLEKDAEEIYFPPREEEEEAKRHCLEVRRQLNNYQRYSQGPPNHSPCTCKVHSRPPPKRRERTQGEGSLTRPTRPGTHEDFLKEWYGKVMRMTKICILTPHPEGVKLEVLKNSPVQFPNKKWSGENDMEQFWKWLTELLGFLALQGCKGSQYDKVHLDNLIWGLGEPALTLGVKLRDKALLDGKEDKFSYVLDTCQD